MIDETRSMNILDEYIGIPYSRNNVGGLNCLSFFTLIQTKVYKNNIGIITHNTLNVLDNIEFNNWIKIDQPTDGCGVIMARSRIPIHIGTYVSNGIDTGIIHCYEGIGSIFSPIELPDINMRVVGYYKYSDNTNQ